jgi:hypothetical protein
VRLDHLQMLKAPQKRQDAQDTVSVKCIGGSSGDGQCKVACCCATSQRLLMLAPSLTPALFG